MQLNYTEFWKACLEWSSSNESKGYVVHYMKTEETHGTDWVLPQAFEWAKYCSEEYQSTGHIEVYPIEHLGRIDGNRPASVNIIHLLVEGGLL